MRDQDIWLDLYKTVIASGRPLDDIVRTTDDLLAAYKERWIVRPVATIVWPDSEPLTIKALRTKRRELAALTGYVLVIVAPKMLENDITGERVLPQFIPKAADWNIIVGDNVVGAAENFLFAYAEEVNNGKL